MTAYDPIRLNQDLRSWTNDGSPPPDWIWQNMVGHQADNGTFLLETPLGSTRVHFGHVVIEHSSGMWCRFGCFGGPWSAAPSLAR